MTAGLFFGVLSVLVLVGLTLEYAWSERRGLGWHDPRDTLANLNLAAGNLALGVVVVAGILTAWTSIWAVRPVDLHDHLPGWAVLAVGFLLAELCQYWNHRLSHVWNPLAWGHLTHHSSPHLNLSTGVRINWFYRSYAWLFYLPLPLLGVTAFEFVLIQTVMNGYNLFQHTRLDVPFGPLEYVLVSPRAHRLHHSADPAQAGNYGASLIVFDRLFGTYRQIEDERGLVFGMAEGTATADPVGMNLHYLTDLWVDARRRGSSVLAGLVGTRVPVVGRTVEAGRTVVPMAYWLVGAGVIGGAVLVNALAPGLSLVARGVAVGVAVLAVVLFGRALDRLG